MVFFQPLLLVPHAALSVSTLPPLLAANFFHNLFLNPTTNLPATLILCGLVVLPCIGLAFLIKKLYERCNPQNS